MPDVDVMRVVDDFVAYKRSLGFAYTSHRSTLRELARNLQGSRAEGKPIMTEEDVISWCAPREGEQPTTRQLRAILARQFGLYLRRIGHGDCFVIPERAFPKVRSDFAPYILSHEEVEAVTDALDSMTWHPSSVNLRPVPPAMFRTMYGCALRSCEVRRFEVRDVNLDAGILSIRHSKHDRSRIVPMSHSLRDYLARYLEEMGLSAMDPGSPLFPTSRQEPYKAPTLYSAFKRAFAEAGVADRFGKAPRVHDVRHTAACHALLRAQADGVSMFAFLPTLSRYLGHYDIRDTEKYLHLFGELQDDALSKMEGYDSIYPEVDDDW